MLDILDLELSKSVTEGKSTLVFPKYAIFSPNTCCFQMQINYWALVYYIFQVRIFLFFSPRNPFSETSFCKLVM